MKKVISVILTVLMIFSAMATVAFAANEVPGPQGECGCADHTIASEGCHCCVLCPNIDKSYLTSCAKNTSATGTYDGSLCCYACTGIFPCDCGCACCDPNNASDKKDPVIGDIDDIWTEDAQEDFVDGFQKILKRISDAFDEFFNMIFEFLRLDEILGNN